jgi:hypothetical protein
VIVVSRIIRILAGPVHARRYKAALVVLLATHVFANLNAKDRSRVDDEIVNIYRPVGVYPWWRFRSDVPEATRAAERAVALWRVAIPTGVPGLTWSDVLSEKWMQSPWKLAAVFRAFHPATEEAIGFLRAHGVRFEPMHETGPAWLASMKSRFP